MDYSLESDNAYTVDKWFQLVNDWTPLDIDGIQYNSATSYNLIQFDISDCKYILKTKSFPLNLDLKIAQVLNENKYFFRVSQRSPKDAYAEEYKANPADSYKQKLLLEIKRKEKLLVGSTQEVLDLIFRSKRVMEDLELFVEKSNQTVKELHFVFQPWRPSTGVEFRLFVYNSKLVGICVYKPEFYTSKLVVPVGLLTHWFEQFEKIYSQTQTYTVDVYVNNLDSRVYFIEINPFNKQVDTFAFTYKQLITTKFLLVKIK
jgi:hypothetical protein